MTVGSINKHSIKVQNSNEPIKRKQGVNNAPIMVLNKNQIQMPADHTENLPMPVI